MAKMSKAQAEKVLLKAVEPADKAWDRLAKGTPKLKQTVKQLDDELKSAESREMVDTLAKSLRLQMRPVAEDVATLHTALRRIKELSDDEDFLEAIGPGELARGMKEATTRLEAGRNQLRAAKEAMDKAEEFIRNAPVDADAAGEDWATAVTNVERITTGAGKESADWQVYLKAARAARDARDKVKLEKVRKAKPASKNLDELLRLSRANPFERFEREYDVAKLPDGLRKEIGRDRPKWVAAWDKANKLAIEKKAIEAEVAGLVVEPRDGRKALSVLGLPSGALVKLQAAIDGPDATMAKALEAIAKANKQSTSGKDMVAALKKAGVL